MGWLVSKMSEIPQIRLNDGLEIPAIGFGTYKLNGAEGVDTMVRAIDNGYYLLDSAFNYENEGAVGEAIRRSSKPRNDLRITSKLPGRRHFYKEALNTVQESLYRAQLEYYDLYLIHWPNPIQGHYVEAWQALIEAKKRGMIRSIGVSNFLPEHLDRLIEETGVVPSINQIELHPHFPQNEQRAYNQKLGIVTESWSPLGRDNGLIHHVLLQEIASHYNKTIPQLILRWHIQLGAISLPKATSDERQIENRSIFDFEIVEKDMKEIATLARHNGRRKNQDPAVYEEL